MAKKMSLESCESTIDVERWAAEEEAPLHAEIADIDRQIVALRDRKAELHHEIDAIEKRSAERRYELRDPDAGPDQVLVPDGALDEATIENLRRLVNQYDRR